ncbi:ABC transporter ATP-binding protein, partial [Intrasporangium oryzae NRRL B-24470]
AAAAAAAAVAPAAAPAASPEAARLSVRPEPDGTAVTLDVSFWPQSDGLKHPLVLLAHGFGGSKDSVADQAKALQDRGYVVVTWSARGHGASGGRIHLNDPAYEIADARALLDAAAKRADVELDAAGDPRAGVLGGSYGGALGLMLAGADPRVDAVVSAITWNDLADAFFPQAALSAAPTTPAGRTPIATPGPFKQVWASTFFLGSLGSAARAGGGAPAATSCGRFDPTICRLFVQASETGTPSPALLALLRAHSPRPTLTRVTAPTMLVQGIADSLFGLDQADANAKALAAAGTPVAVRWSDGGHDGPSTHEAEETEAGYAWLDHYVRDKAPRTSAPPTEGFVYPTAANRRGQPSDLWSLPAYPGLGGSTVSTTTIPLATTRGGMVHPPGGQPAALVAVPALSALGGGALSTYQIAALPGQSTALDTDPVEKGVTVVGSPTVRLTLTADTPTVTLFASLWRLNGDQPVLPNALVAPIRVPVTPGKPTTVTVSLPAATYEMPTGSRWRVLLTTTESTYSNDRTPSRVIVEAAAQLSVPTSVGAPLGGGSAGGPDTETVIAASVLAALLVLAAVSALLRRRRRRLEPSRPDLADVPLVVDSLVKTYADGHRAVDDVSWRAEKGQVVGLLGPNGAGKTTTMRMVMGLISSDSGSVHVLGEPVHAGAPVLGRVGALIEGPGFLPHLTGRANLEAYWAATGRAPEEARFDEALDVAALGGAVDRPVKSYSHGMKQRLGIAQAMLGMPDLLILDEPTNGLDPPQIAAMRPILRRYAETGRTVVVSSHLLAEVEMTCTHVVVMHAGRVITQGAVADLVDSNDTTIVDLADGVAPDRLAAEAAALRSRDGIGDVRVETPTRLVVVADVPRAEVVLAAVEAGLPVVGVSSRRHLEEVFLGVISTAQGGTGTGSDDTSGSSMIERLRQVRAR